MQSKIICLTFSLFFLLSTGLFHAEAVPTPWVRIAVFSGLEEFRISVNGHVSILDAKTGDNLLQEKRVHDLEIKAVPEGIMIGDEVFPVQRISILPDGEEPVLIAKKKFRGTVNVIKDSAGHFLVVNSLGLEEYIKGVLYQEVSHRWPMEALKAQAIAARTYAMYRMQTTQDKDFDVTSDIYSQVYGGRTSERYRTNLAVDKTKGKILMYEGKILPAYFHATCAGTTEDVSELWKEDMPPLKGVVCEFCKRSPHYDWSKNLRSGDVQDKLNANGYHLGLIKDISVAEKDKSGRNRTLVITTRDGESVKISGKDFRNLIGPNIIRSNKFDIEMKGYYFDLTGHGWGHGVGLCQWGAEGMARLRKTAEEILTFYYPGVQLVDIRTLGSLPHRTIPKEKNETDEAQGF